MPNIVDIIEEYIKTRLSHGGGIILFRRSELAEKFSCVPSQINYVLSTRFSTQRGYIVETRRGGGGYVRVVQVHLEDSSDLLDIIYGKIGEGLSFHDAVNLVRYLYEEGLITKREAYMIENVIEIVTPNEESGMAQKRAAILKSILMVVLRHEK